MRIVGVAVVLGLAPPALAGGLYVSEFATSDMGAAGAGLLTGRSGSPSAMVNPAASIVVDSHSLHLGLAPGVSTLDFDADAPAAAGDGGEQGGFVPLLSSAYVHVLHERVRLGLGVFSISGASLDPDDDWAGRSEATQVSLVTLSIVPSVTLRLTDWLTIGGGPFVTYGTLDWDLRVQPPAAGSEIDVRLEDLDDWGAAALVGVLFEPHEDLRLGVVYQSETDLRLRGETDTSGALGPGQLTRLALDLPQAVRAELTWQAFDRVAFTIGGAWEDWSALETTEIRLGASPSRDISLGFQDTWKLKAGVHLQASERLMLQTGVSYDSSSVRNRDRIAALPIDEQWRWGIGGTWDYREGTRVGFAFQWAHLGDAPLRGAANGEYERNDLFFFVLTLNLSKLPWDGMATL